MTTELYNKKFRAIKSVFMAVDFPFCYVADLGEDVRYIRIRVMVDGRLSRPFLRIMKRHYMFFYELNPLRIMRGNEVTFLVALPAHRQEFVDMINHYAKISDKLFVL